ncbi:GAF domain-containing protein [Chryseobacterium foetidum]|uniref:GAF domain-containing protein n=1 Tax=Chryseobacterium foetidum TaxID=2951057 RepID=UPI0021C5E7F5|nr:GAF domain-containing protein [Chryseobacterium foetidum]
MSEFFHDDSPFQVYLSFKKYLDVLEHIRYNDRLEYRVNYAQSVIERFKKFPELCEGSQDFSLLTKHKDLIRMLLADLFPTGLTHNEIKAASIPFTDISFNYTERFRKILSDAGHNFTLEFRDMTQDEMYVLSCCIIVQLYFKKDIKFIIPFYYDIPDQHGIIRHYKITVNSDFSEIIPIDQNNFPTDSEIEILLENLDDVSLWKKHFPPQSWMLKGFNIFSLVDCTSEVALSDLKSTMIQIDPENPLPNENLKEIFKSYFDVAELNFGLMLMDHQHQKLEKLPIYENVFSNYLLDFWINLYDEKMQKTAFQNIKYNPKPIVISDVDNFDDEIKNTPNFSVLTKNNIKSFMVIPIVHEGEVLALMEFTSEIAGSFNGLKLRKLDSLSDILVFSLNRFKHERDNQIEAIIQREYTTIHNSVIWKFRNEAEKYFNASLQKKLYTLREISFKNLSPLFGVSDIRSSSDKRFQLMLEDLNEQIDCLHQLFTDLNFPESEKYLLALDVFENELNNDFKADTEQRFQYFLREEIHPFLQAQLEIKSPESIKNYFSKVYSVNSLFYSNRRKLDESITLINRKIADILDESQMEAQEIYPHYFERFKSDGVEHNLYIGQNLNPSISYTPKQLNELRYWQLKTICKIEHEFENFSKQLPVSLEIASLIFVYNERIDIRFRMDEKRFDVDGAHNSFYEIIKKRLEKAKIKDSTERITCPGKITIVYFGMENQKEYLNYISRLQKTGILKNDVELLRVEDLQGASGLLAMRVSLA